jgi:hypothetical protein
MWETTSGVKALEGAESKLIRNTIYDLIDLIRATKSLQQSASVGVALFDELSWEQQLVMLLKVARQLLDPTLPPLPKSALMDATVAAIYAQLRSGVQVDIDFQQQGMDEDDDNMGRRREIIDALNQCLPDRAPLNPASVDGDQWDAAVESLRDGVLPDEDWNLESLSLDLSPEQASELKTTLGIEKDYFIDIPPDGDERPPRIVWADLVELITGTRPNPAVFD